MSNAIQHSQVRKVSASDDLKRLGMLYDEHAAVVLGFLEKLVNDKAKAEELLQAFFLTLPSHLHEFDAKQGSFVVWLLRLARTIAGQAQINVDFKTNGSVKSTNTPIHDETTNVDSNNAFASGEIPAVSEISPARMTIQSDVVLELLYVKGYTFAEVAAELGVDVPSLQLMVRTELKKYRS